MIWVVDTCVVIDLVEHDGEFGAVSAAMKRPIADVMIGAYALQKGGLITRNEDDFRSLYPDLTIYNPVHPNN